MYDTGSTGTWADRGRVKCFSRRYKKDDIQGTMFKIILYRLGLKGHFVHCYHHI